MRFTQALGGAGLFTGLAGALDIDWNTDSSIKEGASIVASDMLKWYTGMNPGDVPGNLPDPYYWWEAGAMFGALIDYWAFTGDESHNDIAFQAMLHQTGDDEDYMPKNQTKSLGNDDQGFWLMAAMTAAEMGFKNPDKDQPQWLALVQAGFNEYIDRWDDKDCGGGLRWQIWTFNNGYNYKNSISNGCFFNIAARLARYSGNQTYADWANKIWDWQEKVKFIDQDYNVLDGAGYANGEDCKSVNKVQFTYNAGIFLHGAAHMYNMTEDAKWKKRVEGMTETTLGYFAKDQILNEIACEPQASCNVDQQAFKGHLARWLAYTAKLAPSTYDKIAPVLKASAAAAAQQCSGTNSDFRGKAGQACGFSWLKKDQYDGKTGIGEQMNALSVIYSALHEKAPAPFTADTGGTSKGNPNAGSKDGGKIEQPRPITTADRAGAGILTALVLGGFLSGAWFVTYGE